MPEVLVEPEQNSRFIKAKSALKILNLLGYSGVDALVIRENELLTPDRRVFDDDFIIIRPVTSRG